MSNESIFWCLVQAAWAGVRGNANFDSSGKLLQGASRRQPVP